MIESRALTGDDLALADVWEVAVHARPVALADSARERMGAARELVEQAAHGRQEHTYGVNTGFGRFVSRSIPEELTEELQLRLLRSHACGVGEPYPDEIVRAAMLLRANALAKGYSGARPVTVELLMECLNRGVLPHVPSRGSVGASGDLAPLAHLALPLIGEGEATFEDRRLPGGKALEQAGLEPVRLQAKEGLSLVNGTQFMAAFGALGMTRADRLAKTADIACALSLEALQGSRTSFLPQIQALRPLQGQSDSAANVLRLLEDSAINESHRWCDQVQDAYSLRCAPQVHGASRDLLDYVRLNRENALGPGEIVTAIRLPVLPPTSSSAYVKLSEKESFDWPLVEVCAVLEQSGGTCARATIVLGAVAHTPLRAVGAERALVGKPIDDATAAASAARAVAGATPTRDNGYKVQLVEVAVKRAILAAAAPAVGGTR